MSSSTSHSVKVKLPDSLYNSMAVKAENLHISLPKLIVKELQHSIEHNECPYDHTPNEETARVLAENAANPSNYKSFKSEEEFSAYVQKIFDEVQKENK